jgi:hypothetical protein
MNTTLRNILIRHWGLGILIGSSACLGACHHHDDDRPRAVIVDDRGYRHEGYRDEHGWHGGYYDERHEFHDDPHEWHYEHH